MAQTLRSQLEGIYAELKALEEQAPQAIHPASSALEVSLKGYLPDERGLPHAERMALQQGSRAVTG